MMPFRINMKSMGNMRAAIRLIRGLKKDGLILILGIFVSFA